MLCDLRALNQARRYPRVGKEPKESDHHGHHADQPEVCRSKKPGERKRCEEGDSLRYDLTEETPAQSSRRLSLEFLVQCSI